MKPSPPTRFLAAVLITAASLAACRSGSGPSSSAPAPAPSRAGADAPRDEARYIAMARADSLRHPWTAADVAFMAGMIHHHAQAIIMARWAPTHGASVGVRTLCERIINAQQDEIRTMQGWLRDRRQPVPDATATPMKMVMDGMEHEMLMPGMLSDEQMKALDAARGADFDRLFLTGMIQHHTGAITMVKDLFANEGAGQDELTFKLASDINVDQTTEIARMQKMLAAVLFDGPGS